MYYLNAPYQIWNRYQIIMVGRLPDVGPIIPKFVESNAEIL